MNLYELRKNFGKTQEQVAEALGVSRPTYSKYESGQHEPSYDMLKKLAGLFGCSIDYLLGYAWREFVLILLAFPVCYLFTHGVKDFFYYHNEVPTLGGSILICLVFTAIATLTPDLLPFV